MPGERKIVVTQNISANGVIEFLDPWFEPSIQTDDQLSVLMEQSATQCALLLGRQTFEDFRGFWPLQTDDTTGITAHLNQVAKFVYSSTMTDPDWQNSTVVSGELADLVGRLSESEELPDGDVGVTGSIRLVHALFEAELVDELRLYVYPALTGRGRGLVPDGLPARPLVLAESRAFRSGVTLQTYVRD